MRLLEKTGMTQQPRNNMTPKNQFLKTRDDRGLVQINYAEGLSCPDKPFSLADQAKCSWVKHNHPFGTETLRPRIEPWLTALVQSEHLSLLIGSGLTHAAHEIAGEKELNIKNPKFGDFDEQITKIAIDNAKKADRKDGNYEDRIQAANELLKSLKISHLLGEQNEKLESLQTELTNAINTFASSILAGEKIIKDTKHGEAMGYLVSFLMSFASRTGTRDRLHLFTTNYDRFIETAADLAGLRLIDRFVGTLEPIFRASRLNVDLHYNPPGIRGEPRYLEGVARFTKLHGSIDWIDHQKTIKRIGLPFGAEDIKPYLAIPEGEASDTNQLMIYPNASKDRETAFFPYVELFRDFAAAICQPNSTLICYGYSFGDEHINRVIEDMLTIPSAHLVIISYDDPLDRIIKTYNQPDRRAQITLLVGDHLGNLKELVDNYLPKPAIDRATMRMSELLKNRWGGESKSDEKISPQTGGEGTVS